MHCYARDHAETVSHYFHELLRTSIGQIFTFLSCTAPHINISTNSGIPILTILVCSHLLQIRYHHSHYQMRGRTRTRSQHYHSQSTQGSQPSHSYCWQSSNPHHAFENHACFLYLFSESGRIPNFWP